VSSPRVLAIAVPANVIGGPFCVYVEDADGDVVASYGGIVSAGRANVWAQEIAGAYGGVVASCPYRSLVDSRQVQS
jgi:hypothetical protein